MKANKNRWFIAAAAVGIHISIGSVYAYSAWKMPLESAFGWKATQTTAAFSLAIFFLGFSAAFLGRVVERKGPRFSGLLSAVLFPGGLLIAAYACHLQQLWMFYLGYGVVGGVGLGLGYLSPVSTLVKWFPDRRGLATGLAIMGFGFGGLVCTLLIDQFVPAQKITDTLINYQAADISHAFAYLAVIYAGIMIPASLYIALPPDNYAEQFAGASKRNVQIPPREFTVPQAVRTPELYGLWLMLFLNVCCGIAVISTAKKMGVEMVHLSVESASFLVMGISVFNGLGRLIWSAFSDRLGRDNVFISFFVIQVIAFPLLAHLSACPFAFMAVTFLIISCYGGGFSCAPAYISDLFGLKEMPTLYGLILTAWSIAGIVGPMLTSSLYEKTHSYQQSLYIFGCLLAAGLAVALFMKKRLKQVQA
ncbi:OFA family MFS transporter [Kiritimatiellaeota bacterium B1221]|nr:OFA family MFS transporter [Kiritimatiellaeota bacterium B1221]